jgi:4-amino-4-deoxy-L-arabinose transferase-like glycosyltransferase
VTSSASSQASIERAARIVTIVASVWYALAVTWGLFARMGGGHDAQIATRAIVSENIRHWHIIDPVKDYFLTKPTPSDFYVHHPWGTFWTYALFSLVLGRGTWVPRLVGVLWSVACPPLLYGIGRRLWGPIPGAICALAYTVLPIALAFGNMPGFEVPTIFSCLLATWGYLRFAERWKTRWMLVSAAGVLCAVNSDWQGSVFVGTVLVALAAGHLGLPRWFGRAPVRPFARWWVLCALLAAGSLLGYVAYFQHIGAIENFAHSETQRARGEWMPLVAVLSARSYWIDVTFTPLAVTIGKIAAVIFLLRVLLGRRLNEVFALAILLEATVEYVLFKNGADVHIYWPEPFAPYWALSMGMLASLPIGITRWVLKRRRLEDRRGIVRIVSFASLGVFGLIALVILPDGIRALDYAKSTAGRFNEKGRRIFNDIDLNQAVEWMAGRMTGETTVGLLKELASREYRPQEWAAHRPIKSLEFSAFSTDGSVTERYFISDLRFMSGEEQRHATQSFHVVTVGSYVFIDRDTPRAPLDAYSFDEREPNFFEWYFESPAEPIRTIRPDPWLTWELRVHYDQQPNPPPAREPATLDEIRIAHNIAVTRQDAAAADKYEASLLRSLDQTVAKTYPDQTRLLGMRYVPGVDPILELYFQASHALGDGYMFEVSSEILARPKLSLVPPDDRIKGYGVPFVISPSLWRAGFVYVDRVEIRGRPGREDFTGRFEEFHGPDFRGSSTLPFGEESVHLMTLK